MKNSYTESLAHTTWECKYHIVFASKYRIEEKYLMMKIQVTNEKAPDTSNIAVMAIASVVVICALGIVFVYNKE